MSDEQVKMDAELKAKWLEALRSGKYKQGRGVLRNGECHCCLGVLADIVDPNAWTDGDSWNDPLGNTNHTVLDYRFEKTIGLTKPWILMDMNDGEETDDGVEGNKTFAEIADYIEENV